MRLAYQRYSGPRGFTTDDFLGVVREVGGADVASWLSRVVSTTEELDYAEALSWFGVEFSKEPRRQNPDEPREEKAFLGASTRNDAGRLVVMEIKRGTPAFDAGVSVDDEIVAIDGFRVAPDGLDTRLEQYRPGDSATLTIARRARLLQIPVKFGAEPENQWHLRRVEKPSAEQTEHFAAWLH